VPAAISTLGCSRAAVTTAIVTAIASVSLHYHKVGMTCCTFSQQRKRGLQLMLRARRDLNAQEINVLKLDAAKPTSDVTE
jgi:hypothetical protein